MPKIWEGSRVVSVTTIWQNMLKFSIHYGIELKARVDQTLSFYNGLNNANEWRLGHIESTSHKGVSIQTSQSKP